LSNQPCGDEAEQNQAEQGQDKVGDGGHADVLSFAAQVSSPAASARGLESDSGWRKGAVTRRAAQSSRSTRCGVHDGDGIPFAAVGFAMVPGG